MSEDYSALLASFLDDNGRLTQYPAKRKKKNYALLYLSSKFEPSVVYTEWDINEILDKWHSFHDPATLRRELYNNRFLDRTPDGKEYSLSPKPPTLEDLIKKYG